MQDQRDTPADGTLPDQLWALFDARSAATPDRTALVDDAGRSRTWAELADEVERIAAGLAELGLAAGATVSWQLPTCIEAAALSLALCRSGIVQNPIIAGYGARELRSVLAAVRPAVIVVEGEPTPTGDGRRADASILEALADGDVDDRPRIVTIDTLVASDGAVPAPTPIEPGAPGWICFTSGSTSLPKGAIHPDRSVLTAGRNMAAAVGLDADDRYAIVFPFAHIGGMSNLVAAMISGMQTLLVRRFDPETTIPMLREFGLTIGGAGPPFFAMYIEAQRRMPDGEPLFPAIRCYMGGGAPTPPQMHRALAEVPRPAPICIAYGLTEVPIVTSVHIDDPDDVRAGTVGRPRGGAEIRIADPEGRALPPGAEGEVLLRGPQVLLGYVDPALDADAFVDGWFRTGDLGRLDEAGNLAIVGRLKDVIIRNMENIAPTEIEDLLMHHPAIREVAVIGLPDERTGERVCAVVVPREGTTPELSEVGEWAQARGLARPKIPTQLEVVDTLPLIGFGKVDKTTLKQRYTRT